MFAPQLERRKEERKTLRRPALLLLPTGQIMKVSTLDIGTASIGILAEFNPPEHLSCAIQVSIPAGHGGSTTLELQAKVTRCMLSGSRGGFVVGLELSDIPPSAKSAIAEFLQR